ncbi:patatin-like phospholipase family protein [Winogradskyella echinorum]|uniref:Patatin-like phospholipase family protein n=1 Tax=Winogradskyella echinorum TaxID=538189 RepID=A0ABR6XYC4_9FLAO|nr:patatin-like phospholipase family protein [Winogradskyella echinorum]MBC3845471.1 patatin-like phospholipase family protein [Winogradskyella echinorum]MBC5749819.1 patatin-like phospholipase family protein [Winogradskyella echinorum]
MKTKNLILILFIISFFPLKAQNDTVNSKPKVGLVLSGGGAKGFAHIGALKVIDSLGIKIDYVAGTSMGAIIGSLYATGYSGKQLEAMFNTQDFDELINDNFPRASKPFYERENAEKYAVSLPFDNFKINLPSALSRGQNVYNLLYQLMLPVNDIRDFDKLPIPFFCIATDIETGESIIMDKGKLAEAVTASGALPSLFQPVIIDDKILIDGGVTNNFPVEELRAKGMDIIIGIDVQDDLKDKESLISALDILSQINNYRTINAMKNKIPLTDIYIKPDITNFSVISFNEGGDIIANGEAAARANMPKLLNIRNQQVSAFKRPLIKTLDSIKINSINIKGNERYTRSYLLGKLKFKEDENISYSDFKKGINSLIATNNFDTFRYYIEPSADNNGYNLLGKIKESETTTFLRLGVHYDGLYKSAALANLTKKRLLFNNDIASLDLILGDNSRYNFDYFIDKGYYISIGVKSMFNQFHKNINPLLALDEDSPLLTGLNKIDIQLEDFTNQFYVQTIFRKDFALRVGAEYKRLKITSETLFEEDQDDEVTFENTGYFSLFGNLKFDDYDDPYFPKKGFYFNGDFHLYLNASNFNPNFEEFSIAKADIGYAFSFSDNVALKTETSGGFKIGESSTTTLGFGLGGYANNYINNFSSFYGYDYLALSGDSFVKATFTLDYEIFKKHHMLLSANFANIDDGLFETGQFFSSPNYSGYAIGYSLETLIGPLEGKYTYSPDTGNGYWFFNLGFWF